MKVQLTVAWLARRAASAIAVCFLFNATVAHAQDMGPVQVTPVAAHTSGELRTHTRPLSVDVDLVLVPTVVTDALDRPVTTLGKQDFEIFDENDQQEIKYFNGEDAPISVGILLDTSGSMKKKYELAQRALAEFFRNANRDDDYFVITFSNKPEVIADTTQSIEQIESQLATVVPSGSTPLLDAIYLGLHKLRNAQYPRRALLIISDGGDNDSRYRAKEIRSIVRESDVQIYAMGIFTPLTLAVEDAEGKKLLNQIAQDTGGRAVFFASPERLPETAVNFSRELRSQYVLGYRPRDHQRDGKLHRITVKLTRLAGPSVQIHYKRQYLAMK